MTYVMLLWYVYPAHEVVPVKVVPLVRLREGMGYPVIFPTNQSLGKSVIVATEAREKLGTWQNCIHSE